MLTATTFLYKKPCNATALQRGELDALTCYCYRYLKPLTRYAAYVIKNEYAAPDLAAINMEHLWNRRHEIIDERSVHNFLRKNMYIICCQWLHEQLIIQGFLPAPEGWAPKYSKMENPNPPIPKSNPSTNPKPDPEQNPERNPNPKTNANP
jgi:hypothetical protein